MFLRAVFCCLFYLNYKHPSSFTTEADELAVRSVYALDCTYGAGGHSVVMAKNHCKVCAIDCDTAVLVSARRAHQLTLKARINMCKPMYDIVVVDAGVSLAQAKSHWRQFSRACVNRNSATTLNTNTQILFNHVVNSLTVGGKLLVMVYNSEFVELANKLNTREQTLYLINKAPIRPKPLARARNKCSSNAAMLIYIKTSPFQRC